MSGPAGRSVDRPAILVTRPGEAGERLAAELEAAGWRALFWPLFEIVDVGPPPELGGAQAALVTSANALRRADGSTAGAPALCVGAATARAAKAAGFADARSADGDAAALADLAAATLDPADGPLVFLRGEETAGDLAGALRARGFDVREQTVYAARRTGEPSGEVAGALAGGRLAAACFWSPRASRAFADRASPWRAGLAEAIAVAISAAAAEPLAGLGFAHVSVAARPDAEAMRCAIAAARPKRCGDAPSWTGDR